MFIFDCHLDLSMNALLWNRDLTQPATDIRRSEQGMTDKKDRTRGTVTLPDMRRGKIGLCVATQIARYVHPDQPGPESSVPNWHSVEIAWSITQGQLAWYKAMEDAGEMVQITDLKGLDKHVALWQNNPPSNAPIGYILSLEGADSIRTPKHLEQCYAQGLRALGPAHYGPGRYSPGTNGEGGLTAIGRELIVEMNKLGIILDVTHLTDEAFWQSLEIFDGPVWASHNNCRTLVPHQRQFSDEQLKALIARDAVIGGVLDAWMLTPGWIRRQSTPQEKGVKLANVLDHMDHICDLAGNARNVGIGSDLDGGFGTEQGPMDLDTIADLSRIPGMLAERGYSADDITGIAHGNWLRFLHNAWK